jgi:integrase/recombinase XerD
MYPKAKGGSMDAVTRTAVVVTRHRSGCPHAEEGPGYRKCACKKSLVLYDGKSHRRSAKTTSWEEAERQAREWLDSFDPVKMELRALKASRGTTAKTIEQATAAYLAAKSDLRPGTLRRYAGLLGDGEKRKGRLGAWLDTVSPRPVLVADLTPEHVLAFRQSWKTNDQSSHVDWTALKSFLRHCETMRWVEVSPAHRLKGPKVRDGNRTAHFTDDQCEAIRKAAFESDDPRLLPFAELLRHSGMALEDATKFDSAWLAGDVLSYRRAKSGRLAVVVLPQPVVELLGTLPKGTPFLDPLVAQKKMRLESCKGRWRRALNSLFAAAGIDKVQTDLRARPPHPHMFRDTLAVDLVTRGATTAQVARALGDTEAMVARRYLPFAEKLRGHHVEAMRGLVGTGKK